MKCLDAKRIFKRASRPIVVFMGSIIRLGEFDSPASSSTTLGLKRLAYGQGIYFLLTGLWPVFDINSFLWITGPKTDLWLVRTFGLLIAAVGFSLIRAARENQLTHSLCVVGSLTALALAVSDSFYVALGTISPIYLGDAVAEIALVFFWRWLWPAADDLPRNQMPNGPGYY
jgi:hypothetical protein